MKKLFVILCVSFLVFAAAREATCATLYATGIQSDRINSYLVQINSVTAEVTDIGPVAGIITDLAYSPSGTLYGYETLDEKIVTIDISTGNTAFVSSVLGWSGIGVGIAFGQDGTLYASDNGDFVTIDTSSGAVTTISSNPGVDVDALAFSSSEILYGINGANPDFNLYTFDLNSGIETPGIFTGPNIQSLAFDPSDVLFGINNGDGGLGDEFLVIIDPNTGNTTNIGSIRQGFYTSLVYGGPDPIPVPATMLLLGSGLVGLAGFRRKNKK